MSATREYLPELPLGWSVTKLRRVVNPSRRITYGIVQAGPDYDGGVPYIRPIDMSEEGGISAQELRRTSPEIANAYVRSKIETGDLVVSIGPSYGKVMVVPAELRGANLTQGTARVAVDESVATTRFAYWCLRSPIARSFWDASCGGATFSALNLGPLGETPIPLPPLPTQRAIADFLDRKTRAIDKLIRKKERLIELLQEKRLALITQTVTKGLDPNVPMKDSGVPWLGEIPAHWTLPRIGYVATVFNGSTPSRNNPDFWLDEGVPWISSGKVNEDLVSEPTAWISRTALRECSLPIAPVGSVIVGMVGQGRTRGMSARLGIESTINQNMAAIVPSVRLNGTFLHYLLTAAYSDLRLLGRGANQPALNCEILRAYRLPLPPKTEQTQIVEHLDSQTQGIRKTIDLISDQLIRLGEYRQALISAAVTGQIEVAQEAAA